MIYSTTTNSVLLLLVPAFLAATGVDALNDWKVPCTKGSCSYDLPASADAASGTLKIWGSDNAITDITTAAGWQILGCSPTALNQSIRLVCMDDPADPASQCAHLYQNVGAVNKIVRLPEDCGSSAFARISSAWTPSDQSIPSSIRRRLVRRDGTPPTVKALALDTDFDKVDWSKTGVVNIAILGANVPGAPTEIDTGASSSSTDSTPATRRRSAQLARDPHLAGGDDLRHIASNKIDVSKNFTLPPINFNKNINLINSAVSCAGKSLSLQADMQAQATAQISLSVAAIGTIVPPDMKSFGVIAGMTASVSGTMTMTADVSGRIDSGKLTLFNLGIPGFSFPGILTVGPSFSVEAQLVGDVDLEMDVEVGIVYNVNNAQIAFPPDAKTAPDQSAFQAGDTPLTLNAAPSVSATGTITAHLIPSINLGVEALGGKAEAKVFLALDANAALNMNLDAGITKDATVDGSASTTTDNSTTTDDTSADAAPPATTTTKTFGGCISVTGNVNLKAGVVGSFFGVYSFAFLLPTTSLTPRPQVSSTRSNPSPSSIRTSRSSMYVPSPRPSSLAYPLAVEMLWL
ncbi:hypothetical protein C8R46DRAFT_910485 [Mycena filopes]|nr:hypothetical protein C8R46DRAFT_910485 [Mycena filopes]